MYSLLRFESSQVTMKYFFSFPWQLKHCQKDFCENSNQIKTETLKTSNITGTSTNFILFTFLKNASHRKMKQVLDKINSL